MKDLNTLLALLTENTSLQICINDMSGILGSGKLNILPHYRIHSKPFCDTAKLTPEGFNLCMRCKSICNRRSLINKKPFGGECAFGLFEAVYPVNIGGSVACIIYIGNIIRSEEKSRNALKNAHKKTGCNYSRLMSLTDFAQRADSADKYFAMGEIISDYIKLLVRENPPSLQPYHWAVKTAMQYAEMNFYHPLSLKSIAGACYINEKYLGRIFKSRTGVSFHEYLTGIRLEHAEQLLITSAQNVLQTAVDSGFASPSYFNRAFVKRFGISPGEYKKLHRQCKN